MSKKTVVLTGLFLLVYFLTLLLNDGFMGTDEYWTGITRYVPAQTQNVHNILKSDDVKSPSQILPLLATSHLALQMGVTSPYGQYRFVQFFWGFLSIGLLLFCLLYFIPLPDRNLSLLVFTFYFAAPFVFTRPMYESLSAPFLLLSALSLNKYLDGKKIFFLFLSVLAVSLAFGFRPQTGIAALGLLGLVLWKSSKKDFFISSSLGLLLFVGYGFFDFWILGEWHKSLKDILFYNVQFGSLYAVQPWHFYIPLSLFLLMTPFFISRSWWKVFRQNLPKQWPYWFYIVLILALHSFFPQKWERFVIPVIPLILLILIDWIKNFRSHKIRLSLLLAFNFILMIPASFFPAQTNIIQFSRYLNAKPEIETVIRLNNNPQWITEVFIERTNWQWQPTTEWPVTMTCNERLVMNQNDFEKQKSDFVIEQIFETNWIEKLAYRFNPSKNVRRTPLFLLKSKNC